MINQRLKAIRQSLGKNQQEFSNSIGLEQGSYSGIESGKKGSITKQTAMLLELIHKVNIDFLYNGTGEMFIVNSVPKLDKPKDVESNISSIYECMLDKKEKKIEELLIQIGQLQQEIKALKQDKKIAQEVDYVSDAVGGLKPTGTESQG